MNFAAFLSDSCVIQTRTVDATGKEDLETFTSQDVSTRCRVTTQVLKRKTSPDGAEKLQYGTFVFLNVVLPRAARVVNHDRIVWEGDRKSVV